MKLYIYFGTEIIENDQYSIINKNNYICVKKLDGCDNWFNIYTNDFYNFLPVNTFVDILNCTDDQLNKAIDKFLQLKVFL